MSPIVFAKYAPGQSSTIAVVVVFAILATLALSFVLIRMASVLASNAFRKTERSQLSRTGFFFKTQLGVFAGCLLACNLLTSISSLISINWIAGGGVKEGFSCSSQAVLSEMGNFGSAYFMVVMGIHTFNTLVLRNRHANWINTVLVVGGWVATFIIGVAPAFLSGKAGPLYGATSFDCGFTQRYPVQHLLLHFLPVFVASVLSTILFSLVFLILRGTLTINGGLRLNLNPESRWISNSGSFQEYQRFVNSIGRSMLWFPAAFIVLLLPATIVQLMEISNFEVSFSSIGFAHTLQILFGLVNVAVLFNILRVLGPAIGRSRMTSSRSDVENFGQVDGKFTTVGSVRPLYLGTNRSTYISEKATMVSTANLYAPPPRVQSTVAVPKQVKIAPTPVLSHKRSTSSISSINSTTRLITPSKARHSPASSVSSSNSAASLQRSIIDYADIQDQLLPAPPQALEKIVEKKPSRFDPNEVPERRPSIEAKPTALPAAPRRNRSPVSRDLSDVSLARGLPAKKETPTVERKDTANSSVINLYLSRSRSSTEDMPPLPVDVTDEASAAPAPTLKASPKPAASSSKDRRPKPPPFLPELPLIATSPRDSSGPQTAKSESYYTSTDDESDIAVTLPPAPRSARTLSSSLRSRVRERTMKMASSAGGFQLAALAAVNALPPPPSQQQLNLRRLPQPPASANSVTTYARAQTYASSTTSTSSGSAVPSTLQSVSGKTVRPLPAPVSATGQQSFNESPTSQSLAQAQARLSVSVSPLHIRKNSASSLNVGGIRSVGSLLRAEPPVDVRRAQSAREHSGASSSRSPVKPRHSRLVSTSPADSDRSHGYL